MYDQSEFIGKSKASSGARRAALACALLAAAALGAALVPAAAAAPQQGKPRIADEVEKAKKGEAGRESAPRPEPQPKVQPQGRRPRTGRRPAGPSPLDVTIKTDLPNAEIFLNHGGSSQSLGRTDADGHLTVRLQRGRHSITASRPGARILRQQIEVDPDSTSFTFNLSLPPPPPKQDKVAAAAPAEPTPSPVEEPTPKVTAEEVVRRFLDAKESEALTADDWQQAQEQAKAALEQSPEDKQLQAQAFLAEGQLAYLRGDHATALVSFNKAAIANPDYVPAQYGLGNAYLATNQPNEALAAYRRASELDKTIALPLKGMGDALTKLGRAREATQLYTRAKSFGQPLPTNTGLLTARNLKQRKRWREALKEFEEVVKTEPTAEVYIDIGDCYVGLEQSFSATKAYQKATELDPKNALAHFRNAEVMFREREYAAALEAYERALALDTTGQQFNRKSARERANEAARKLGLKRDQ